MTGRPTEAIVLDLLKWPSPIKAECRKRLVELEATVRRLEAGLEQEVANRERAEEWADQLAYAIAPQEVIGEHSSGNNPWENALDDVRDGVIT